MESTQPDQESTGKDTATPASSTKIIIFLLDGLGDNQNPNLKGLTALQVANISVMD